MIFSTNQIKSLNNLSFQERQQAITTATKKLTVPEKLILNLLKLLMLIPPFIYLARQDWGLLVLTMVISFIVFLVIFRPISLSFIEKHIDKS